ncbi:MAG: Uma2 family endonuclease [Planctomycetes bacterium]|nr:Uma2 family endonuclease [Planctomycetota bacterium]
MATVEALTEYRVLLQGISWQTYESLLKELNDRPIRLTYDRGSLEIMSPSLAHENYGRLIGRFVEAFTEELEIAIRSGGSTTFRKEAKRRGLEPDECYWIQNETRIRGKKEFDFASDPPPDLAIEVDITSSSLERMTIYAALRIPEVWRFDGEALAVYLLRPTAKYESSTRSRALPKFPLAVVLQFLQQVDGQDETSLVRAFRRWVREHILGVRTGAGPSSTRRGHRKNGNRRRG